MYWAPLQYILLLSPQWNSNFHVLKKSIHFKQQVLKWGMMKWVIRQQPFPNQVSFSTNPQCKLLPTKPQPHPQGLGKENLFLICQTPHGYQIICFISTRRAHSIKNISEPKPFVRLFSSSSYNVMLNASTFHQGWILLAGEMLFAQTAFCWCWKINDLQDLSRLSAKALILILFSCRQ